MKLINQSRAGDMAASFVYDMPEMEMISINSGTLDDRMDYLIAEIEEGMQDPAIQKLAAKILSAYNVPSRDYRGEAEAIFLWVRENIRYTRDPEGMELFRKPKRILELGIADCDDMSILIGALLSTIGQVIILRVIGVSSNNPEHIYPVVLIPPDDPTETIALDATRAEPMGWEVSPNEIKFSQDYEPNFADV